MRKDLTDGEVGLLLLAIGESLDARFHAERGDSQVRRFRELRADLERADLVTFHIDEA